MKKIISVILILCILSLTACSTKTQEQQLTINDIIEQSDGCVVVSTMDYKERMTQDGDLYYTQVILLQNNLKSPPEGAPPGLITIIQEGENYIKQEEKYIIFVNCSETDENHFYVTGGKSGVIKLEKDYNFPRDEYDGKKYNEIGNEIIIKYEFKYKCLDKNMQESVEKLFGEYYDDKFDEWLYGPPTTVKPFYHNGTTAAPVTGLDKNIITTAPET